MTNTVCVQYPEIYVAPPSTLSEEEARLHKKENERKAKLYVAVRAILESRFGYRAPPEASAFAQHAGTPPELDLDARRFLGVYGILRADNLNDPEMGLGDGAAERITVPGNGAVIRVARRFIDGVVAAVQEYAAAEPLFANVTRVVGEESKRTTVDGTNATTVYTYFSNQIARVTRHLVDDHVEVDDAQLDLRIRLALSTSLRADPEARSATEDDFKFPDVEETASAADIIADNLRACAKIFFVAHYEEWGFFAVADYLAQSFNDQVLPVSEGPGARKLFQYLRSTHSRMTEPERRALYARTLGHSAGTVEVAAPNREFGDLWMRFLSAVSAKRRESITSTSQVVVVRDRAIMPGQHVIKAAKDLAVNLSLHGFGIASQAGEELLRLVASLQETLSREDILRSYAAADVLQLIERVNSERGLQVNGYRLRTMAKAGGEIMRELANMAPDLSAARTIDEGLADTIVKTVGQYADAWLAVTGTVEDTVQKFAAPVNLPTQPTLPRLGLGSAQEMLRGMNGTAGGGFENMLSGRGLPQA